MNKRISVAHRLCLSFRIINCSMSMLDSAPKLFPQSLVQVLLPNHLTRLLSNALHSLFKMSYLIYRNGWGQWPTCSSMSLHFCSCHLSYIISKPVCDFCVYHNHRIQFNIIEVHRIWLQKLELLFLWGLYRVGSRYTRMDSWYVWNLQKYIMNAGKVS